MTYFWPTVEFSLCRSGRNIIFTMVTYFFCWTLLKFFSSFPDEQSQQKVRQLDRITAQWLIHQMKLRARYCGNFEFIIFLWEFWKGSFVGSIVNIRNECLFSGFMGNESKRGTNKSAENRFAVHAICLSRAKIHSQWTQKKRHSFLKAILQVLIYKALYDKSYLGSKTTMTSGEWTCLISFATAPLTCSERGGSEKFKMKIYVSSGIRTHAPPVHDRKGAAP